MIAILHPVDLLPNKRSLIVKLFITRFPLLPFLYQVEIAIAEPGAVKVVAFSAKMRFVNFINAKILRSPIDVVYGMEYKIHIKVFITVRLIQPLPEQGINQLPENACNFYAVRNYTVILEQMTST